jgi:hypothetical protein
MQLKECDDNLGCCSTPTGIFLVKEQNKKKGKGLVSYTVYF